MASGRGRAKLTVGVIILVGVAVIAGALLQRHRSREDEKAIRHVLSRTRHTGHLPERVDPDWPRLSKKLDRAVKKDPEGDLADLALRATSRVKVHLPSYTYTGGPTQVRLQYGDTKISEAVLPDRRFVWTAVVSVAVNRGPWYEIHRDWWADDRASQDELDLNRFVPEQEMGVGRKKVAVRVALKAYTGEQLPGQTGPAFDPDRLAERPARLQEVRTLGPYSLFVTQHSVRPGSG